jgi:hypothetical protein
VRVRGVYTSDQRKSVKEGRGHFRCHYGHWIVGAWDMKKSVERSWVRGRGHEHSE